MTREIAYAKVNLALHVRGREADGYHRLETIFAFAEDGDRLEFADADVLALEVTGPFASAIDADNLVLRAARSFATIFRLPARGRFRLDKRLPVAAGIGGGSADAAAALRLLGRHHEVGDDARLEAVARDLGADVPACLRSIAVRGEGRGDDLVPLANDWAGLPLLLVNPGVEMPTGPVFRGWDGLDRGALGNDPTVGRNDLESPAIAIAPVIADVLARLRVCEGASLARMSGSGATCFALFANEAARDAADMALAGTGWWRMATRLR